MFGESSPALLARVGAWRVTCLLKYSSMLSMKIATGVEIARRRGISWLSVVVRRAEQVAAIEVEQVDEVVDDAREVRIRRGARAAAG